MKKMKCEVLDLVASVKEEINEFNAAWHQAALLSNADGNTHLSSKVWLEFYDVIGYSPMISTIMLAQHAFDKEQIADAYVAAGILSVWMDTEVPKLLYESIATAHRGRLDHDLSWEKHVLHFYEKWVIKNSDKGRTVLKWSTIEYAFLQLNEEVKEKNPVAEVEEIPLENILGHGSEEASEVKEAFHPLFPKIESADTPFNVESKDNLISGAQLNQALEDFKRVQTDEMTIDQMVNLILKMNLPLPKKFKLTIPKGEGYGKAFLVTVITKDRDESEFHFNTVVKVTSVLEQLKNIETEFLRGTWNDRYISEIIIAEWE